MAVSVCQKKDNSLHTPAIELHEIRAKTCPLMLPSLINHLFDKDENGWKRRKNIKLSPCLNEAEKVQFQPPSLFLFIVADFVSRKT